MYVLMCGLMIPALARVFLATLAPPGAAQGGPPPPFVALPPACVAALLVVVALVYDWRRGLRPHKAYVYGGLAMFLINFVAVFIAGTQTWMQIALWLEGLGG
jgi:drug/metabolite transporter (DMT)-like permease